MKGYRYADEDDLDTYQRLPINICTACICSNGRFKMSSEYNIKYKIVHDDYM